MKSSEIISVLLLFVSLLFSCGRGENGNAGKSTGEDKITIAVSTNMQYAIKDLIKSFTEKTGITCEQVLGSSGKLTAQIKAGAPYDLFLSADLKYPQEIFNSGLAVAQPEVFAFGELVLWTMKDGFHPSIDSLTTASVQHIVLANPKTAPYGEAAVEVLQHYKIYNLVENKLVFGESIAQVNQFITSKSAEIGFTALSVVMSPEMKGKGHWIRMDTSIYTPLSQGMVVIKKNKGNNAATQKFYDYLSSAEAKQILISFGYSVDE